MTIQEALQWARVQLDISPTLRKDIESLLCHVLSCQPLRLISYPEQTLTAEEQQQFVSLIEQRRQGVPVAHLTGVRGFWSLEVAVNQHTLIPRPDTELLVSLALEKIQPGMRVADLGTGSGAIALAIKAERDDIWMLASDYSLQALTMAKYNAEKNQLAVQFVCGQWLESMHSSSLDIIVSNPPYIRSDDPHLTLGDLRFEPLTALASGEDGLQDIRQLVQQAARVLKPEGWLMIEHGYDQSSAVQGMFQQYGFNEIQAFQDYGQQDRVVIGKRG
ncbi:MULTISPECIES: peptide chain release factor N(5)-glutamine methyltransferase [unclassified Methylophaga]|jgi:release factor glutamine methyltransferase|uniref:peptide chain release factor N(5)-glutamine methyltransferase n=1 Tax=unclassified Methylophaga TaxID=2629249 RepID=UPI000C8C1BA5|nr:MULTISPECIES: peptide chain release factor N(5)-glutamine methyltransferase [unclassified Methylophaga]MAK67379.1 protein-(glutamine-N5) methyltransferase, release factor-specific [Methylophaga sp.]MAY16918.1 protein-(glutamine-N5) methyltransferase, release factor-specific [Methylophaga sp.]HCD05949.1 peptide chain release factor N(5)-glutamine methyltransferase [Methylophaga sp.]|tara:strand:- start:92059 stop:92883 length:825 start_codon:yes stop_codon:yes gene_type:complete